MIKSILQAIPLHLISCIKLPQTICNSLEKNTRKFFWGGCQREKKIHWVWYDFLCQRKTDGGVGLRKVTLFNEALLAKQGWNLIINPNSLLARIFKALYYPHSSFKEATAGGKPSPYWKGLLWGRLLLLKGLDWRIGNGTSVSIRQDWLSGNTCFRLYYSEKLRVHIIKVSDLIDPRARKWRKDLIARYFDPIDTDWIIPIPPAHVQDKIAWFPALNGKFSVKSAYWLA